MSKGISRTIIYPAVNRRDSDKAFFAHLEFNGDVSAVHPYMHARTTACHHRSNPPYARFYWEGKECVIYETTALAGVFQDREEAKEYGPKLLDLINETYNDRGQILPAEPDQGPLKAIDILRILPRNNCKDCGFDSCLAFSVAVSQGKANPWSCPSFPKPGVSRSKFLIHSSNGEPLVLHLDQIQEPHKAENSGGENRNKSVELADMGNMAALSERELQVLELMALGFSNKEIAQNLDISPNTVKTHTAHIFDKLDCTDRTQASVWASRAGLV